jgi:hypothetical protein
VPTDKSATPRGLTQWPNRTALSGQGFLRSMDGGATWHRAAAAHGGAWRTRDAGASWLPMQPGGSAGLLGRTPGMRWQ